MAITPLDDAKNVRNSRLFSTALQTLLWCVALAVLGQNLLLLRQNRQLRDVASKKVQVKIENQVNPGSQLDDLTGINLYGVLTPIALPVTTTERLLIITMSPTCPICETNRRSWIEMTKDLKRRGNWKVLWLSRDPVPDTLKYCQRNGIPAEDVLADPGHRTYTQLALEQVPHMVVVDHAGVVEKVWGGFLNAELKKNIFSYFDAPPAKTAAHFATPAVTTLPDVVRTTP